MLFADVAAPETIKQRLTGLAGSGRVAHALLFFGEEGGAQLPTAVAFARYLFCENRAAHDSCGTCPSCIKVNKLAHPDLHWVFPIALSKDVRKSDDVLAEFREAFLAFPYMGLNDWFNTLDAENKQPVIGKDEANDIIRKLNYTSYEGRGKIMIIWMPEKMNSEASNKLLKILEEPPDETFFFLVSSAIDQLLPTIHSRVQMIQVHSASAPEVAKVLARSFGLQPQQAEQVASVAQGNARQAFLLADDNVAPNIYLELYRNFLRSSLRFDPFKITAWIEEIQGLGREKQKQFLAYSLQMFHNSLLFKHVPQQVTASAEEKDFLQKFHPYITHNNQEALAEEFGRAAYHLERNANARIVFMDLALRTNELLNKK
jgi:DNA polymerase III subunit delta'